MDADKSVLYAEYGRKINLPCTYELEKDVLYSIKWYKEDTEFYRYIPKGKKGFALYITSHSSERY